MYHKKQTLPDRGQEGFLNTKVHHGIAMNRENVARFGFDEQKKFNPFPDYHEYEGHKREIRMKDLQYDLEIRKLIRDLGI